MSQDELATAAAEIEALRALLAQHDEPETPTTTPAITARDEEILSEILAKRTSHDATRAPGPSRDRATRWIVGIAAAVVTAVAVAAGVLAPSGDSPASAMTPKMLTFGSSSVEAVARGNAPSANATLEAIASAADRQPVEKDPDAVQRVTSYAWFLNTGQNASGRTVRELAPTIEVTELAPDGSIRNHERRGPALDTNGRLIDPDRYPVGGEDSVDNLPGGTLDAALPMTLPRDTPELRTALLEQVSGLDCRTTAEQAACLYSAVQELYIRWVIPADLSSAIWRVMAQEPDVRLLGETTDRVGRSGVAIAVRDPWVNPTNVDVMVLSATTGQMLTWEQVALDGAGAHPAVRSFQAITASELVRP